MISINQPSQEHERPQGVAAIAALFAAFSFACVLYGALLVLGAVPFTAAAWLVGEDAARMGPVFLVCAAFVYVVAAGGLFRRRRWARWLAIALLLIGLWQLVPVVSSAVVDLHPTRIAIGGAQIIVRVAALWYLFQESVAEAFH